MADDHRRRCCSGEDRISGLPDELLHDILARLRSARAASRTSALSRRWRRVWSTLPVLTFHDGSGDAPPRPQPPPAASFMDTVDAPPPPPSPAAASFMDTVDAALAAYAAPTLIRLDIALSRRHCPHLPAGRVAPWLRFAAEHAVAELSLLAPPWTTWLRETGQAKLELPTYGGAKTITLSLQQEWRLRLCRLRRPAAGSFASLTSLVILEGCMEGGELTALVSKRCPCLMELRLHLVLVDVHDVSIFSGTLRSMGFHVGNTQRLEVVAPRLEELAVSSHAKEAYISSPKLAKLVWQGNGYDPRRHRFADVGRRLRLLQVSHRSVVAPLMRQFDEVEELILQIYIPEGMAGYQSFLNETEKLPKCETLSMSLVWNHHRFATVMLHLFRSCNSTRKFSVRLLGFDKYSLWYPCPSACPCRMKDICRTHDHDIAFNSLEEVEITSYARSHEELELVEQLSRYSTTVLKQVVINRYTKSTPHPTKEACEKIRSMFPPDVKFEFYMF